MAVIGDYVTIVNDTTRYPSVFSLNDYYVFGDTKRWSGSEGYRYGLNGKENDNEVKGEGNSLDFGSRIYDSRLGRFLSIDPMTSKYPDLSAYSFAANSPIWLIDKEGEEPDRNRAGTIEQATAQWSGLKVQTISGIREYIQNDKNAVRYIYTEDKGWIDLLHYFGTLQYGKIPMDILEPVSGNHFFQNKFFGPGANESYYSYEDLPSNQFAHDSKNLFERENDRVGAYKKGGSLIESVKENFEVAKAVAPESAPNWKQIPFMDHGERKRLPDIKGYKDSYLSVGIPGASATVKSSTPVYYTKDEKEKLLQTGLYVPQNHSRTPYNLKNFPAAPSSIEKGNKQEGITGH
jgi:RHS repeat-associated protein